MTRSIASALSWINLGWIKQRIARRALASIDMTRMSRSPAMVPLRRDGLDPVAELGELRRAPITKLTRLLGTNLWLVAGYDEARCVLAGHKSFSNDIRPLVGRTGATGAEAIGALGSTDAPDHTRLRKLLTPEFTMRKLRELEPRITQIVEEQLDVLEAAGPGADLVQAFAFPVPFRVIWRRSSSPPPWSKPTWTRPSGPMPGSPGTSPGR